MRFHNTHEWRINAFQTEHSNLFSFNNRTCLYLQITSRSHQNANFCLLHKRFFVCGRAVNLNNEVYSVENFFCSTIKSTRKISTFESTQKLLTGVYLFTQKCSSYNAMFLFFGKMLGIFFRHLSKWILGKFKWAYIGIQLNENIFIILILIF